MNRHAAEAHRRRKALGKEYGEIYDQLSLLFTKADPIGIGEDAPADEYSPEVGTVLPRLSQCATPRDVQVVLFEEFSRWFDPELAGPIEGFGPLAAEVWKLWQGRRRDT